MAFAARRIDIDIELAMEIGTGTGVGDKDTLCVRWKEGGIEGYSNEGSKQNVRTNV